MAETFYTLMSKGASCVAAGRLRVIAQIEDLHDAFPDGRLTRLTNGFSKKAENLKAAVALHFAYYNLVRKHRTLHTTPAVAAGVVSREWTLGELVWLAN